MYKSVIIGCGAISKNHAEAIRESGNTLAAACDINKTALDVFCEKYDCRGYTDFKLMLDREKPDAVHICLPHYLHFDAAAYALERNIAVLLEKPPVTSALELEKLKEYSDKKLTVCFQNRFNETTTRIRQIIASGEYGALLGANAAVTWKRGGDYYKKSDWRGKQSKECGGALINQAIHTLDLLCLLLGSPTAVKAAVSNLTHPYIDVEDTLSAVMDFGEKRATLFATTCACSSPPATVTLIFEKARIEFDNRFISIKSSDIKTKDIDASDGIGKSCWGNSHTLLISKFYEFIGGGQNPCSITDCEDTMKLLFDIYGKDNI